MKKLLPIFLILSVLAIVYGAKMYQYPDNPSLNSEIENIYLEINALKSSKCGIIHWLSTTVSKVGGTDYTADGDWTDLSLQSATSTNAKFVFLVLAHNSSCTAEDSLAVRKNGETPGVFPRITAQVTGIYMYGMAIVAMDSNQVIEYNATDASDTKINILGYIE